MAQLPGYQNRHGYAAIFNFVSYKKAPRPQAIDDVVRLVDLLPQFGYNVAVVEIDPSIDTVNNYLDKWETDPDKILANYDSFLLVVSGHGNEFSIATVCGRAKFFYSDFENALDRCKSLENKPKWILYSTCNGGKVNYGVSFSSYRTAQDDQNDELRRAERCDFLVSYAAIKGQAAWRTSNGTYFLTCFTSALSTVLDIVSSDKVPDDKRRYNVEKLMKSVNYQMKMNEVELPERCGIYQMSETVSRLTQKFSLFYSKERGTPDETIAKYKTKLAEEKEKLITILSTRVAGYRNIENFLNPANPEYDESTKYIVDKGIVPRSGESELTLSTRSLSIHEESTNRQELSDE